MPSSFRSRVLAFAQLMRLPNVFTAFVGQLVLEMAGQMPRDATLIAILPRVPVDTAIALGMLRRQGFAITAILIGLDESERIDAHGRLLAETVRDTRFVNTEAELMNLGSNTAATASSYAIDVPLA